MFYDTTREKPTGNNSANVENICKKVSYLRGSVSAELFRLFPRDTLAQFMKAMQEIETLIKSFLQPRQPGEELEGLSNISAGSISVGYKLGRYKLGRFNLGRRTNSAGVQTGPVQSRLVYKLAREENPRPCSMCITYYINAAGTNAVGFKLGWRTN